MNPLLNWEVNVTSYKHPEMTQSLVNQLRGTMPQETFIRVWENSPQKYEYSGVDEIRWNRFNPSLSRVWNWAIAQSLTENLMIISDDINLHPDWYPNLRDEVLAHPDSLWHGPSRAFLVNRRIIDVVGWFDERFIGFCYEDLDFVRRLNASGAKHHYGPLSGFSRRNDSLREHTVRAKYTYRGDNESYFNTKYNSSDTENFVCNPNFPTIDFYPNAERTK